MKSLLFQFWVLMGAVFVVGYLQKSWAVEETKECFLCKGTGTTPCMACKDGHVICPGPCLKKSEGPWIHMDVKGHGPHELWRRFDRKDGVKGYLAFTQNHVGEVVVYQKGIPVNIGKCKICGGKTYVNCSQCKGTALVACSMCEGKKVVPISWTMTDNPKMSPVDQDAVLDIRGTDIIKGNGEAK